MASLARVAHAIRVQVKRIAYEGIGRDRRQQPERVLEALRVGPGMRIADIGAGLGYFAFRFADSVGRSGVVYAVDTDPDLRVAVADRALREDRSNVHPVPAAPLDPALPEPVDLMFASAVLHLLPDPATYFQRARRFLRPGGRVAILEARLAGLNRHLGHAMAPDHIRALMEAAGYLLVADHEFLARHSLQVFEPTGFDAAEGASSPGRRE